MKEQDFEELADFISQVVVHGCSVVREVSQYRKRFTKMKYCLPLEEATPLIRKLWEALE